MKRIMYMAITANGLIARDNDDTSWITKAEWDSYSAMVRQAGCMIIGHRTYDIITTQPEFAELKDVKVIIVANSNVKTLAANHIVATSPEVALKLVETEQVIVAGGGGLNAAFLSAGLVDEIYLDVEPLIFGEGIPVMNKTKFNFELQLLETRRISNNEIQLHYKIVKNDHVNL